MADPVIIEKWRQVEGWPYEVSNLGRLRRSEDDIRFHWKTGVRYVYRRSGMIMQPTIKSHGYRQFNLWSNGNKRTVNIAWLVCEAFHGKRPTPIHEVAHWNGCRSDDRADNLRWATRKENFADRERHGMTARGERSGMAKLTERQVLEIRARIKDGETQMSLVREFGLNKNTVNLIHLRRIWRHLEN